jgi:cation-transporting ATPase E
VLLGDSFAALPRAVQEGQRVVNGMQQILRLFLTRVASFTLQIPGFPFSPRQSSLVTLLTVGIPTVALAAWAQPGPTRGNKLLLRLVHFVLPAILTGSLATLFVFLLAVALAASWNLQSFVISVRNIGDLVLHSHFCFFVMWYSTTEGGRKFS